MGGLFGSTPKPAPVQTPIIPEPTVMPLDDATAERARRRSLLEQQQRGGRASTILSTEDTLG